MFEDARRLPPRHRRRQRRREQGDVRVRATGAAGRSRCARRARRRSCAPSSSTTRPRRGRPGTRRRRSATNGPRPAATASTTSWASRCSGTDDPDLDVEVIAAGRRLLRRARTAPGRPARQLDGRRRVPCRLRGRSAGVPGRARGRAVRRAPGALARQPAARARLQASRVPGACTDGAPHAARLPLRGLRARTSPRCARASTPLGVGLRGSTRAWCGASTTTPARPSSSLGRPSTRPRTRWAAADATTGSSSARRAADAGDRLRHAVSSGCCSPATPKGRLRRAAGARSTSSWSTSPAGTRARDLVDELRRVGLAGDRGLRRPFDEGPDEGWPTAPGARFAVIVGAEELAAGDGDAAAPARRQRAGSGAARGDRGPPVSNCDGVEVPWPETSEAMTT